MWIFHTRSFAVAELPDIGDCAPCQRVLLARLSFLAARIKQKQPRMRASGAALLKTVNPSKVLRYQLGLHGPTTSSPRLLEPAFLFLSRYCSLSSPPFFFGFGCLQLQLLAGQMNLTALQKDQPPAQRAGGFRQTAAALKKSRTFQSGSVDGPQELNSFASASVTPSRGTRIALIARATLFIAFATNQIFFKLAHNILMVRCVSLTSHSLQTNCRFSLG